MTKAVVFGTNCYPFLLLYWLKIFEEIWQDEVDKVYVAVSEPIYKSVWHKVKEKLEANPKIQVYETDKGWPSSLQEVVKKVEEDLILIKHDDTFIYDPEVLKENFRLAEAGYVVTPTTPTYSNGVLVEELMKRNWGDAVPFRASDGTFGYSFFCHFFFIRKDILHTTNIDFSAHRVEVGEWDHLLAFKPLVNPIATDVDFKIALELLGRGHKFHAIPKHEMGQLTTRPNDPIDYIHELIDKKENFMSEDAKWVHIQTMAYHIMGLYWDTGEKEAAERASGKTYGRKIEPELVYKGDPAFNCRMQIRIAWIYEFMKYAEVIKEHRDYAKREVDWVVEAFELDKNVINEYINIFHNLIWDKESLYELPTNGQKSL